MSGFSTDTLSAAAARVGQSLVSSTTSGSQSAAATARTYASTTSTSTTPTATTGTQITSKDFLTLLVTEMKNQDPTQPTDPNAYIQQLVGVNSLQQLISINQHLSGTSTTATGAGSTSPLSAV